MRLRVLSVAEAEATSAACWYGDRLPTLGERFLAEYAAALTSIVKTPLQYSPLEGGSVRHLRRCRLDRFPYAVVYEVLPDEIVVLAVVHARRRPRSWRD